MPGLFLLPIVLLIYVFAVIASVYAKEHSSMSKFLSVSKLYCLGFLAGASGYCYLELVGMMNADTIVHYPGILQRSQHWMNYLFGYSIAFFILLSFQSIARYLPKSKH